MTTPRLRPLLPVLLLILLCSTLPGPARSQSLVVKSPPNEGVADFTDKWLINGNAIGNAMGAVFGQTLAVAFFGPAGWVVGSAVGGIVGGLVGEWVDNQVYRSYNYAAFNRPALGEPGSVVLENAGPMEQLFYQFDSRVFIGGNVTALLTHFGLNLAARAFPGFRLLASPAFLVTADYLAGILGDNLDGQVDLAAIGARLDRARGFEPANIIAEPGWKLYDEDPLTLRELYRTTLEALRDDEVTTDAEALARARENLDRYSASADGRPFDAPSTASAASPRSE